MIKNIQISEKTIKNLTAGIAYAITFVLTGAVISYLLFSDYNQIPHIIKVLFVVCSIWQLIYVLLPDERKFLKRLVNYLLHMTITTEIVIAVNFLGVFDNERGNQIFGDMFLYRTPGLANTVPFLWDMVIIVLIACGGIQLIYLVTSFFIRRRKRKKDAEADETAKEEAADVAQDATDNKLKDNELAKLFTEYEEEKREISKFNILVVYMLLIAITVGVTAVIWRNHLAKFEPFLYSRKLEQIRRDSLRDPVFVYVEGSDDPVPAIPRYSFHTDRYLESFGGWNYYRYRDFAHGGNGYSYIITTPKYFGLGGGVQVFYQTEDDVTISFYINVRDMSYSMDISEKAGGASVRTDKSGRPLRFSQQHPEMTEAEYNRFLELHEEYSDLVKGITTVTQDAFGSIMR